MFAAGEDCVLPVWAQHPPARPIIPPARPPAVGYDLHNRECLNQEGILYPQLRLFVCACLFVSAAHAAGMTKDATTGRWSEGWYDDTCEREIVFWGGLQVPFPPAAAHRPLLKRSYYCSDSMTRDGPVT